VTVKSVGMVINIARFLENISHSKWRFAPVVALAVVGLLVQHPMHQRVFIGATGAMIRSRVAERLAKTFTRDTGVAAVVVRITFALSAPGGQPLDIALAHRGETLSAPNAGAAASESLVASRFVIVGPSSDPADVRDTRSALDAIRRIQNNEAPFRPAPAGTAASALEEKLWREAGVPPPSPSLYDTMDAALTDASECDAYMLVDRLSYDHLPSNLTVLFSGGGALQDQYVAVKLASAPDRRAARAFWTWLRSDRGRTVVRQLASR